MEVRKRILVAGASGVLGMEIVKLLTEQKIPLRVLAHSSEGATELVGKTDDIWKGDAAERDQQLNDITKDVSTVISALGKSVSLFSNSDDSFLESDYLANKFLLEDAVKNKVKRFVYISIKGADAEEDYSIAKSHKMFENELKASGLEYTIVRPVGFFSGLNDLVVMAKRKVIPIIGDGEARTNSIHHKDLAKVVLSFKDEGPKIIEIGGPLIHTRMEMAEMIKEAIGGKIFKVPKTIADIGIEIPKIFDESMYNKLDYFTYITTNDMIGESHGSITFREYLQTLDLKEIP